MNLNWTQIIVGTIQAVVNASAVLIASYFITKAITKFEARNKANGKKEGL